MLKYVAKRIFYALITIWLIATITFFLMKAIPGDPFHNPKMPASVREALYSKYGFNESTLKQYGIYLKNLAKGDLGISYKYEGRSVTKIIKDSFPKSFAIGWRAMLFSTIFGLIFGIIAALKHQKTLDYFVIFIAIIGVSIPNMVLGPLLAYFFGVSLDWLPVTVREGNELSLILPSFTLGLGTLAFVARMMRSTTLEVLGNDYIQTAKAKGLSMSEIIRKHVVRNSIMPVVTVLGPLFAAIITGSIIIESIFAVAGLGGYFVNTILEQDYSMIMGITLFYAILIITSVLLVDLAYGFIDPRLKVSSKGGE